MLLYAHYFLEIISLDIFAHSGRHTSHNEVEAEKIHEFLMDKGIYGSPFEPSLAQRIDHRFADA